MKIFSALSHRAAKPVSSSVSKQAAEMMAGSRKLLGECLEATTRDVAKVAQQHSQSMAALELLSKQAQAAVKIAMKK